MAIMDWEEERKSVLQKEYQLLLAVMRHYKKRGPVLVKRDPPLDDEQIKAMFVGQRGIGQPTIDAVFGGQPQSQNFTKLLKSDVFKKELSDQLLELVNPLGRRPTDMQEQADELERQVKKRYPMAYEAYEEWQLTRYQKNPVESRRRVTMRQVHTALGNVLGYDDRRIREILEELVKISDEERTEGRHGR